MTCREKTVSSIRKLELGICTIFISAQVAAGSSAARRAVAIKTFKITSESKENVANWRGTPTIGIGVVSMGLYSFGEFWGTVKRWTCVMTDISFVITNAVRNQNVASTPNSRLKANGRTAERSTYGESPFQKRPCSLLKKDPSRRVCCTSNCPKSCSQDR